MLIEKLKEKLREITEPSLKLNAIKAYLSKHLESFVFYAEKPFIGVIIDVLSEEESRLEVNQVRRIFIG